MTTLIFILPFLVLYAVLAIYAERKISAFIQDRLGPMEVGYYGIAQTIADLLKLLQKEDIVPAKAEKGLFRIAPLLIFVSVFAGFAVLPLAPNWHGAALSTGIFFLLAIISLDVIGIIIAGWSSNNKYSVLGTMRSAAQIISYEIPMGLSVLCVCIVCETLDLQEISVQQGILSGSPRYLLDIPALGIDTTLYGGFLSWNIFRMPVLILTWVIFFIASLAECNRAPFDLPEAESELVAGFQTEYSGFRWAVIMLGEYAMMLLVSILGAVLFFGSWNTPLPDIGSVRLATWTTGAPGTLASTLWGIFWLLSKSLFFVAVQIWIRWTYPRLRVDQLMNLSWKYLTPLALILIILCAFWKIIFI
ncbi:NADH-quinone oxidoreductase subunit H [Fulvivirgaceae bacterium PWU4]|uniref:NADH-quinone oxidoreductase subunit H n=1 Tax=Chryseosolibacter histidini TaxID=2782349 RepID=A0AAP2DH24_9BACT|nr:complex I subunit 1 family protein [Chryseosolibacter histidini]MBT1696241.1 NADH-quinone oxidoreductase subunit H [Chryseosolibacter histidini]